MDFNKNLEFYGNLMRCILKYSVQSEFTQRRRSFMNFELQTSQKLAKILTTEQLQHLEILQLSNDELENLIYERATENPLINTIDAQVTNLLDFTTTVFNNRASQTQTYGEKFDVMQQIASKESSLAFIFDQIPLQHNLSENDIRILKYLIYNLDKNYFLDIDTEDIAQAFHVEHEVVLNLLYLLQSFEPFGIGARNLKEYLLIQVDNDLSAPPLAAQFIQNHLDKVAKLSLKFLSNYYKVSVKEVKRTIQYIRTLNPTPPTSSFNQEEGYIVPEIVVECIEKEWVVQIQHPLRPKIEINEDYVEMLKNSKIHDHYYKTCMKDILLLTQGIEQRDRTLYTLARMLIDLQQDFFEFGIEALKPIRIKDIAATLNLHESTISRAIRNKYIKTPHGVFALRSLFVKGLTNHSGKMDSVAYVKSRIQELVVQENSAAPLTDQQLTMTLQGEGIQISRRTVAKYREELNIHSSSKRAYIYKEDVTF